MQKIIRRTVMAERQAARRLAKKHEKGGRKIAEIKRQQNLFKLRDSSSQLKQARLVRREDYELGPLAPRRDVGKLKEAYGTMSTQRMRGIDLKIEDRIKILEPWGGRWLNLRMGDRVVILEGRDKGNIGEVIAIDKKRAECTVKGLNMMDVEIPTWMISEEDPDKRPLRSVEQALSLSHVRLVYPLTDPNTGLTRDVIVKKIQGSKIWWDKQTQTTHWTRSIAGLNIQIPWPKHEKKEHEDNPDDTPRLDVEAATFVPTLLTPPMPLSVIDELRNKYSKFRTRHDPEYIERKEAEEREKNNKRVLNEQMRTPLQDFHRRERKLKKAKGKGLLTSEMLEKIGEIIARKKADAIAATMASANASSAQKTVVL